MNAYYNTGYSPWQNPAMNRYRKNVGKKITMTELNIKFKTEGACLSSSCKIRTGPLC